MRLRLTIGKVINLLAWLQLIGAVLLILTYNGYCWFFNTSNHAGFHVFKMLYQYYSIIYILSSLELAIAVKYDELKVRTNILILSMIFALFGVLNIIIYDKLNIMMYYDDWISRGMPDKPISDALRKWF